MTAHDASGLRRPAERSADTAADTATDSAADLPTAADPQAVGGGAALRAWALRQLWLWPALVTFLVTAFESWRPVMGQDELISWSMTRRSASQVIATLHHVDAVHGAYYLLLNFWTRAFGDSLFSMRLPGVLGMTAAAAFVTLTARIRFGNRAALVSGLLFAFLPTVTWYAQDIRSYPLVVGAAAGSTWMLMRALEKPTWPRWVGYAVFLGLAGLLNLIALTIVCGHAVVVALRWWQRRERALLLGFLPAAVVAGMCTLPVVLMGEQQASSQVDWVPRPTVAGLGSLWVQLFTSWAVAWAAVVLIVLALVLAFVRRSGRRAVLELAVIGLLPVAVVLGASMEGKVSYWLARYLLFTVPALAIVMGSVIASLRLRTVVVSALVVVTALGLPAQQFIRGTSSHDWFTYPEPTPFHLSEHTVDFPGAAKVIEDGYRPGDAVAYLRSPVAYRSVDLGVGYYLPRNLVMPDVFLAETAVRHNGIWAVQCTDPGRCLAARDPDRIWVVTLGAVPGNPFPGLPGAEVRALDAGYSVTEVDRLRDMTVTLVVRK